MLAAIRALLRDSAQTKPPAEARDTWDLYRAYGIDANAVLDAVAMVTVEEFMGSVPAKPREALPAPGFKTAIE